MESQVEQGDHIPLAAVSLSSKGEKQAHKKSKGKNMVQSVKKKMANQKRMVEIRQII